MIFTPNQLKRLLKDLPVQLISLAKPNEELRNWNFEPHGKHQLFVVESDKKYRTKWHMGQDYSVRLGSTKPGIWQCPKCKFIYEHVKGENFDCINSGEYTLHNCVNEKCFWSTDTFKPLRFVITDIRKKPLHDVTEEDAKKLGYKNRIEFLKKYYEFKCPHLTHRVYMETGEVRGWNPTVWLLQGVKKK